jgi:N-acetylmuramic acid 6-phosphate etherase
MSIKMKILFLSFLLILSSAAVPNGETGRKGILELLQIKQSEQSIDYVNNQKQFQLHSLITEQRHAKTWNLSYTIKTDTRKGLEMLLSVDKDITEKIKNLSRDVEKIKNASSAVEEAILKGKKVYFYGCGATGRLAKQMESSFWRPFWKKIKSKAIWKKLSKKIPADIETQLIGEMTGGDRALISSLEGFEDLQLIGKLQLKDRGIKMEDVVICVTEGGETSSVIGTILAALEQYGKMNPEKSKLAKKNLYFIYNNPDEVLRPFARSRKVLENPYVTKINLTTGSQSITGSTRMQATTSETFVTGIILEHALDNILKRYLTKPEMDTLGFRPGISISKRLLEFIPLQESVYELNHLTSEFTELEAGTYANNCFSTYFANNALITVFIDSTERSPTFRLFPLDTVKAPKRKSWIQVWTTAKNGREAWKNFLGRPFYGLKSQFYKEPFLDNIKDKYLKAAALSSLKNAGDDQQFLYDFSFADFNKKNRCPQKNDLGVLVLLDDEIENLNDPEFSFCRFIDFFNQKHTNLVCIVVSKKPVKNMEILTKKLKAVNKKNQLLQLVINVENDPLWVRQHIALKMLLNAHSTAVMAKLGKVVGNTMTSVNPGNLKLIGRATYLIQSHVNDVLSQENWTRKYGNIKPVTYNDANAVLFDTVDYLKNYNISGSDVGGSISEVDISIIRVLEAYRRNSNVSWESVMSTYRKFGLESYLISL